MRKIFLTMHTGYVGMDSHEAWLVPDDVTDKELDDWAYWKAVDHAESYGIYPPHEYEYEDEVDEDEEYDRMAGENIEGHWRLYKDSDEGYVTFSSSGVEWNEYR